MGSIFELKKASFGAFWVLEILDWGCKYPFAHFQGGKCPPLPMPGGARSVYIKHSFIYDEIRVTLSQ